MRCAFVLFQQAARVEFLVAGQTAEARYLLMGKPLMGLQLAFRVELARALAAAQAALSFQCHASVLLFADLAVSSVKQDVYQGHQQGAERGSEDRLCLAGPPTLVAKAIVDG